MSMSTDNGDQFEPSQARRFSAKSNFMFLKLIDDLSDLSTLNNWILENEANEDQLNSIITALKRDQKNILDNNENKNFINNIFNLCLQQIQKLKLQEESLRVLAAEYNSIKKIVELPPPQIGQKVNPRQKSGRQQVSENVEQAAVDTRIDSSLTARPDINTLEKVKNALNKDNPNKFNIISTESEATSGKLIFNAQDNAKPGSMLHSIEIGVVKVTPDNISVKLNPAVNDAPPSNALSNVLKNMSVISAPDPLIIRGSNLAKITELCEAAKKANIELTVENPSPEIRARLKGLYSEFLPEQVSTKNRK